QCVFIPAVFVFLGQNLGEAWPLTLAGIALGNVGMAASGSLLGALSVGQAGRESLLSIVLFPLLVPLLLAGVRLVSMGIDPEPMLDDALRWAGLASAFDGLFLAAGLLLFPYVYSGED
ncbi:MAG: heme exporter protein CcmB, partial [Mailhella sp.]|nr:heme exporter protein CcmB [Mailhella sp.]